MKSSANPGTVDGYIRALPPAVGALVAKIRATVRRAVPTAEERISYRMPAFFDDGVVLYYAAFQGHIGLFPPVRGDAKLMAAVARYRGPKGNLQLPLDEPIPYPLIARIAKARHAENRRNAARKRTATAKGRRTSRVKRGAKTSPAANAAAGTGRAASSTRRVVRREDGTVRTPGLRPRRRP